MSWRDERIESLLEHFGPDARDQLDEYERGWGEFERLPDFAKDDVIELLEDCKREGKERIS